MFCKDSGGGGWERSACCSFKAGFSEPDLQRMTCCGSYLHHLYIASTKCFCINDKQAQKEIRQQKLQKHSSGLTAQWIIKLKFPNFRPNSLFLLLSKKKTHWPSCELTPIDGTCVWFVLLGAGFQMQVNIWIIIVLQFWFLFFKDIHLIFDKTCAHFSMHTHFIIIESCSDTRNTSISVPAGSVYVCKMWAPNSYWIRRCLHDAYLHRRGVLLSTYGIFWYV